MAYSKSLQWRDWSVRVTRSDGWLAGMEEWITVAQQVAERRRVAQSW